MSGNSRLRRYFRRCARIIGLKAALATAIIQNRPIPVWSRFQRLAAGLRSWQTALTPPHEITTRLLLLSAPGSSAARADTRMDLALQHQRAEGLLPQKLPYSS